MHVQIILLLQKKPRQNLTASSNSLLGSWILWARNSFRAVLHDIWGFFWKDLNDRGGLKYLVAWIIRDFFTYIFGTCSGVTCRLCSVETFNWRPICGLSKGLKLPPRRPRAGLSEGETWEGASHIMGESVWRVSIPNEQGRSCKSSSDLVLGGHKASFPLHCPVTSELLRSAQFNKENWTLFLDGGMPSSHCRICGVRDISVAIYGKYNCILPNSAIATLLLLRTKLLLFL